MDDRVGLERADRGSGAGLAVGAVLLVVLWALGIGPVGRMVKAFPPLKRTATVVYAPLIWLCDHTAIRGPLEKYAELWGWK
jgi:hypothetical protein